MVDTSPISVKIHGSFLADSKSADKNVTNLERKSLKCMYMYVCMYVLGRMYVCMYVCMYVLVCMHVCACMYACMCMYVHVCMHVCACMYACMCMLCMFVCMYVCMYSFSPIHNLLI